MTTQVAIVSHPFFSISIPYVKTLLIYKNLFQSTIFNAGKINLYKHIDLKFNIPKTEGLELFFID